MLGAAAAASVDVVGVFDSPLWFDMDVCTKCEEPGADSVWISLPELTQIVYEWVNATARLGASCGAAYPEEERWKCLLGEYRLQHMQTSFLVIASQAEK